MQDTEICIEQDMEGSNIHSLAFVLPNFFLILFFIYKRKGASPLYSFRGTRVQAFMQPENVQNNVLYQNLNRL